MKALLWLVTLLLSCQLNASSQAVFDRISPSVVKVRAIDSGNAASGFVWQSPDRVVTSLHVVDGSQQIAVEFSNPRVTRQAKVERVLKDADLVLLRITNPPQVSPLQSTAAIPSVDQEIHALGYPLSMREISSFSFKPRYGGRKLADNVSSKVLASLRQNGYPDPQIEVLKLGNESLLPGLSGAPIFDATGTVVAIGNGGLEEGALNISWGIPASHLQRLAASDVTEMPGSQGTQALFAAELDAEIGPVVESGQSTFIRVRTRSLATLLTTADDQLGLSQLATVFAVFEPLNFSYDIYQDASTGATLVVPQGASLHPEEDRPWPVQLPFAGQTMPITMYVQIENASSVMAAQSLSEQFETWVGNRYPDTSWAQDPQWSYLTPIQRFDGLLVNRKAWYGFSMYNSTRYAFETLALRNLTFLGVVGVREDAAPQLAQQCMLMQYQHPQCAVVFDTTKAWAHLVLGLQLSGFSL